ncbi:hypothetical protein [Formosa algae]|uniref:DNA-binding transcriptional regulator YhcF (GntR family) n=1 Tax=Formosa algae TaxID=225843 RepID=A0A9X1CAB6_9FLAO|nr:hypothetical protein [Formosa algae]MBP1838772.1 DNA-binding transcriptional regulator YhcF (GntR family) [Formosa algae]MDQ0335272.1 DNA-binding transcriptional regulator YhcF (GntR family) [Formosa algae]OEI79852.1 hypothetical protein AST99_12385 [Formosa algae]
MKNETEILTVKLNEIHSSLTAKSDIEKTEKEIKNLIKNYLPNNYKVLEEVFELEFNKFNKSIFEDFSFLTETKSKEQIRQENTNKLKSKTHKTIDYLSLIEFPNTYDGALYTINEKKDFILKKLNLVFNDNYYSLSKILDLNNIEYRQGETRELAQDLAKSGYLILFSEYNNNGDDYVKLSVKGASYIERKTTKKSKKKSQEEIDEKIEKITEMLIKLGYGQEIIFNEMEEIRDLYSKLNNKNWSELVKGKLIDLGLSQVIEKETISKIFETLIDQKFQLLN